MSHKTEYLNFSNSMSLLLKFCASRVGSRHYLKYQKLLAKRTTKTWQKFCLKTLKGFQCVALYEETHLGIQESGVQTKYAM